MKTTNWKSPIERQITIWTKTGPLPDLQLLPAGEATTCALQLELGGRPRDVKIGVSHGGQT